MPYFAQRQGDSLHGIVPDLGSDLARCLNVPVQLIGFESPRGIIESFREGTLDVTFLGITAERAVAITFGPVVLA